MMETPTMSLTRTTRAVAGALLCISLLTAGAAGSPPADAILIDLEYPGGPATDYIKALLRSAGEINIVVPAEASEVLMPPVSLKRVTAAAALDLLDGRSTKRPGREVRLSVSELPLYDTEERRTYKIEAEVWGNPASAHASVWTIAGLLDNEVSSKAVLSAVEITLEIVGSTTPMDVRFHEDTGLLIASGDGAQLEAIEQVLDRLQESIAQRRNDAMQEQQLRMMTLDAARNQAVSRLLELEAASKSVQQELEATRNEMARRELMNTELRRMLDGKDRELADLNAQLRATEQRLRDALQRERTRHEPDRKNTGR